MRDDERRTRSDQSAFGGRAIYMTSYYKENSKRPRPTAAAYEGQELFEYTNNLFKDKKLLYKNGHVYLNYDFRGKGKYLDKPKKLKRVASDGYYVHTFTFNGKYYHIGLHRLIYAFHHNIAKFPDGYVVNHIDGNKLNNLPENLELITVGDNLRHAVATGLRKVENTNTAKLDWGRVNEIRRRILLKDLTHKQISELYGVSKSAIDRISQNKSWRDDDWERIRGELLK
ncbi:hypothetical protein C6W27_09445 [Bacillus paralicheniformis]|nr:hypothetical protein C6W27_09445 [Bacillus paralicheniformis]